jgi:WD40 repeat protein
MEITRREALETAAAGLAGIGGTGEAQQAREGPATTQRQTPRRTRSQLRGHEGLVNAVAFSPDGKTFASAGSDGTVRIWDLADEKEPCVLENSDRVFAAAFSPDGRTLVSGADGGSVKLWDTSTGQVRTSLEVPGGRPRGKAFSVAFTPDSKKLATACGLTKSTWGAGPAAVALWDAATGNQLWTIEGGHTWTPSVVFVPPDGKTLALAGGYEITIHDATTGKKRAKLATPNGGTTHLLTVSPDGKTLASVELRHTTQPVQLPYYQVVLWDLATGKELARSFEPQTEYITSLAFSPWDSALLASAELGCWHGTVKLWDVAEGGWWFREFHVDNARCISVAFSPDGKVLAAGCDNGIVELWNVRG